MIEVDISRVLAEALFLVFGIQSCKCKCDLIFIHLGGMIG